MYAGVVAEDVQAVRARDSLFAYTAGPGVRSVIVVGDVSKIVRLGGRIAVGRAL